MNKHNQPAVFHAKKWNMALAHDSSAFVDDLDQYMNRHVKQSFQDFALPQVTPIQESAFVAETRKSQSRWQSLLLSISARRKMKATLAASHVDRAYPLQDIQNSVQRMLHDLKAMMNNAAVRAIYQVTEAQITDYCRDIALLAEHGYLQYVDISLLAPVQQTEENKAGVQKRTEQKAYRFEVNHTGKKLISNRPNGVFLSNAEKSQPALRIVLKYTANYTRAAQTDLETQLSTPWQAAYSDISHQALRADIDRDYSSNGFAIQRKVFC